jgi:predicted thioesterase
MMVKGLLLVALAMTLAQVFPSCGGDEGATAVVGWVEAKHIDPTAHGFTLTINSADYDVPGYFFQQVEVGDLVKWDGKVWTIVKKHNAPPE